MNALARWFWLVLCLAGTRATAQTTVNWNSDSQQTNLTSTGELLDGGFQFELGVFASSFTPTQDNLAEWAANWHAAARTGYVVAEKRFVASHKVDDNTAPFLAGRPAYVWGFRGDAAHGEWILFRASSWTWPLITFGPPAVTSWTASQANVVVLGSIHPAEIPACLMQTAAVTNAAPPDTSWDQWQSQYLAGEPMDQPNDDPDHDGTPNLLEYVCGTSPVVAGARTPTSVAVVAGHLEITIPRRVDHPAQLVVEVSADMANWQSGPTHTTVVSDTVAAMVVRDLTAISAAHPRRFARLKVELTTP